MKLSSPRCGSAWLIAVSIVVIAVLGLGMIDDIRDGLATVFDLGTADDVRAFAARWAPWTAVGSISLMILHSFIPLPGEMIAAANGLMFGPVWGTTVTWVGAMIGALLSFGLSRVLGRPLSRRLVAARYWRAAEHWRGRPAPLLLVRLLPMVSFNLINYAAGLSGIPWSTFVWTTAIGILPVTVLSVVFGDQVGRSPWFVWAGLATTFAVLILVGRHYKAWLLRPTDTPPRNDFSDGESR